jgi:NTP pyrophosphatase (non-canonical NTP hydrolase)
MNETEQLKGDIQDKGAIMAALNRQVTDLQEKNTELEITNRTLRENNQSMYAAGHVLRALRTANLARNREWDPDGHVGALWRSNEVAGEIGEVGEALLAYTNLTIAAGKMANTVKKLERERLGIRGSRSNIRELANEMADVLITLDLLAMHFEVDLWGWTREKFNATSDKMKLNTRLE